MERAFALPAPAKVNLFLHVLGRRDDGYHELQTAYALIELADWIDIERRDDGRLHRSGDLIGLPEADLAVRAAHLLQQRTGTRFGADIRILKCIPSGAGLGGGSSDAATTLIALNRLWQTALDRTQLAALALQLGADVPFFVHGENAFAEGRGEVLTPLALPSFECAVIWPQVHVSTREIFEDPGLTRNTKATKIASFSAAVRADRTAVEAQFVGPKSSEALARFGANDLEAVARRRYPEIGRAVEHLAAFGAARMTGSGSAVFMIAGDADVARAAVQDLPGGWKGWAVRGLSEHPLRAW